MKMKLKGYGIYTKLLVSVFVVLAIVLSWHGGIDKHSDDYTHEAIVQAGATYAVARGINAVVSVFQTSTLEAGIGVGGSITVGEMLDPINDLIEKFSHVMTVSLGSLVLQKILILITSHDIFSAAITLLGIMFIVVLFLNKISVLHIVMRLFVLFVFVRFSVGVVVVLNDGVERLFLEDQIVSGKTNLVTFREDMGALKKIDQKEVDQMAVLRASIQEIRDELNDIESKLIPELNSMLAETEVRISDSEESLQNLIEEDGWSVFGLFEDSGVTEAKNALTDLEDDRENILDKIADYQDRVDDLMDESSSLEEELSGKNEWTFSKLKNAVPNISEITEKVDAAVENIVDLLVLFILKTMIMPLLFFYALVKGTKWIWYFNLEKYISPFVRQASVSA